MNNRYDWPVIDKRIRAGEDDRIVAIAAGAPLSTIQHHRWAVLHIPSKKQLVIEANRKLRGDAKPQAEPESKNIFFKKSFQEVMAESAERKRRAMGMKPGEFEAWKSNQSSLSAWSQFMREVRA